MSVNDNDRTAWRDPFNRFRALWAAVGGSADFAANVYDLLEGLYAEPVRHYHRLDHIAHCLRELDGMPGNETGRPALELALWFHDAIYVPGARDNEQRSAQLFAAHADALPGELVRKVVRLILVTTHQAQPSDADEAAMADIDLSAFGVRWEDFVRDSRNVRAELAAVPDSQYHAAQSRFLASLLARPRLYHTAHFFDRCEARARVNIRQLIEHIERHGHL